MSQASKKRRCDIERFAFETAAMRDFEANSLLPKVVGEYLELAARGKRTSTEMLLCSLLPTTATCLGPNTKLRMEGFGDYIIPPNLYLIGVAEPGVGKSQAFDFGSNRPLSAVSKKAGVNLQLEEFTKAGLLRSQREMDGRGIITADEVSHSLQSMLRRSATDTSGERTLLLTLWGGRRHTVSYGTKPNIEIDKSGLCVGGFVQPHLYAGILEDLQSIRDGLEDRFLFWMLPGKVYMNWRVEAAWEAFKERYSLKSVEPAMQGLFEIHNPTNEKGQLIIGHENVYSFSREAQVLLGKIRDHLTRELASSSRAVILDDGDSESPEDMQLTEEANSSCADIFTPSSATAKYVELLGRLALSLHCFCHVMEEMLTISVTVPIAIPSEISILTLEKAKMLLDHVHIQKEKYGEILSREGGVVREDKDPEPVEEDLNNKLIKRLLEEPGIVVSVRQVYSTKIKKRTPSSEEGEAACKKAEELGFGSLVSLKNKGRKPMKVFFKKLPDDVEKEKLSAFGITEERYSQQFFLPLPSSCGFADDLISRHPDAANLKIAIEKQKQISQKETHQETNESPVELATESTTESTTERRRNETMEWKGKVLQEICDE